MAYYERYDKVLEYLTTEEFYPILAAYVQALYNVGEYRRLLPFADRLLEMSIVHHLDLKDSKEVFVAALFYKTAGLYYCAEPEQAEPLARQLIMMRPEEKAHRKLFQRVLLAMRPQWVRTCMAIGVAGYFLYLSLMITYLLIIKNLYPNLTGMVEGVLLALFSLGFATILLGAGVPRWWAWKKTKHTVQEALLKKENRKHGFRD